MSKTVLGVFRTNWSSEFFLKHPKVFCLYLSNQISLRGRFVFKTNGMISSITSYKDHCCSFFMSWVIKATRMLNISNLEKTPNFGCTVHTHFRVRHPIFCLKKDRLCLIRWCVKIQQPNPFLKFNLNHLKKIIFNHSEGGWEGQNKSVPYTQKTCSQSWRGV